MHVHTHTYIYISIYPSSQIVCEIELGSECHFMVQRQYPAVGFFQIWQRLATAKEQLKGSALRTAVVFSDQQMHFQHQMNETPMNCGAYLQMASLSVNSVNSTRFWCVFLWITREESRCLGTSWKQWPQEGSARRSSMCCMLAAQPRMGSSRVAGEMNTIKCHQ